MVSCTLEGITNPELTRYHVEFNHQVVHPTGFHGASLPGHEDGLRAVHRTALPCHAHGHQRREGAAAGLTACHQGLTNRPTGDLKDGYQ